MKTTRIAQALMLVGALLTVAAIPAASVKDMAESMSADGLEQIKVKGIDLVYSRPGTQLASYSKLKIDPVQVAFRKDFEPKKTGSHMKLGTEELERIRSDVGKLVYEEFVKELGKSTYAKVEVAGPDVLHVRPSILDLYVNAPDSMEAGRSRTYTMSAGEMTLVMDIADSETGQVLARVYDKREGRDTGSISWSNSVTNQAEARRIAANWAGILRARLDAAHGIGK